MGDAIARKAHIPELSYDVYHWIIQEVANASTEDPRDPTCVKTLLACCLVNSAWRQLAQPILNQTIIVNNQIELDNRILARWEDHHLRSLRNIVLRQKNEGYWTFNVVALLKALPSLPLLQAFFCYDHGFLPESSDQNDRELSGTSHFVPQPLNLDLSGLRQATLGSIPFGPNWVPLLMITPNLQYLNFCGCGWYVRLFTSSRRSQVLRLLYLLQITTSFSHKRLRHMRVKVLSHSLLSVLLTFSSIQVGH